MMPSTSASSFPQRSDEFADSHHLQVVPEGTVSPPDTFYVRHGKRWFDLVAGSLLLLACAIPMLLVAVAIRCTSRGPSLFIQTRVGLHLSTFRCLKFRTMVPDAEVILMQNPQLQDAMAVSWKIPDDPRITGIGAQLRKTSLDELPQLINVVKGDMSLVGPRPVQVKEIEEMYGDRKFGVTSIAPGMTGLWQVSGRSAVSYEDRIALDEIYVSSCSFSGDLMILVKTGKVVIARVGAH